MDFARSASPGSKPAVVSLTKYIPHPGVAHAGGQYALQHLNALSQDFEVLALAPDSRANRTALTEAPGEFAAELIRGKGAVTTARAKTLTDVESLIAGSSAPIDVRRALSAGSPQFDRLSRAAVIEFQWSEMMGLAPLVRRQHPEARLIGIAHDVITQRWMRAAEASAPGLRTAYRWAASRSGRRERDSFAALDVVVAFSDKDADLIRESNPTVRVEVIRPGLAKGDSPRRDDTWEPDPAAMVLFTGALNRPDNSNAVLWFLENVWARVLAEVPTARFVVAGGGAHDKLVSAVRRFPRTEMTGYVESLDPYYERASVFVVPLFTGAGVKFKTIDAMLRGVPIVATPVGVEGIERATEFTKVADRPVDFAAAVIDVLSSADHSAALQGAAWAGDAYSHAAFSHHLRSLYHEVLSGA
ncbi:glycosyltransferase involved in cell wall biosynthesis [Microbacterium paludicola]|uniref:Glycosyltransferase involved in cell wall biosynthesis n=2 Tax=Microbacterium paludicola TaxID=300019 RepID=A0ABU1I0W0_9MICO|nr:glycosyltransferase involved in cell wall biosynthesis [Microbacterium paludicola]